MQAASFTAAMRGVPVLQSNRRASNARVQTSSSSTVTRASIVAEPASLDILSAPLEIVRTSDVLMLTYSTTLAEAEISIQQSADLKVWADIEPEVLSETVDGDSRLVTVELPEDSAGFVRIVAVPGN